MAGVGSSPEAGRALGKPSARLHTVLWPRPVREPPAFPDLQLHLAPDLHVVVGGLPRSKANDKSVIEAKQGEVFGGGTAFVNDSVILAPLLLLWLLLAILDNLGSNIEDVSCSRRIRATNSQVFYRTGAYLNEN